MSKRTIWRCMAAMFLVVFGSSALAELRDDGMTWQFFAAFFTAVFCPVFYWGMSNNEDQNR